MKRRTVTENEALAFADKNSLFYIESSAKDAIKVDDIFIKVGGEIMEGILSKRIDPKNEVVSLDWNKSGRRDSNGN